LKKKIKKVAKKSVILSFWSRSVDFIDFRVDTLGDTLRLGRHFILSLLQYYNILQNALPRKVEKVLKFLKLSRSLI